MKIIIYPNDMNRVQLVDCISRKWLEFQYDYREHNFFVSLIHSYQYFPLRIGQNIHDFYTEMDENEDKNVHNENNK